jgi:hypothetical protein
MSKILRQYSESFKRSVAAEIESGRYTVLEAGGCSPSRLCDEPWNLPYPKAHMKIILLESTVEVLEEKSGVKVKKKTNTPFRT